MRRMWKVSPQKGRFFLCLEALTLKANIKVSNNKTKPILLSRIKDRMARLLLLLSLKYERRDLKRERRDLRLNRKISIIEHSYRPTIL